MAEFGGRGKRFQCSKLSKFKFFLLFAPKEKTLLCIILNRNTEVELFFKWPSETEHTIQGTTEKKADIRKFFLNNIFSIFPVL